ncbi:MAG: MFS transporter, partial [Pyrinomonadaceae bacterium]
GIAMGGEWGVGTALAMETVAPKWRGLVSGILQSGYPTGYLLAALLYGVAFQALGWRGMFMVALLPALVIFYIRRTVPESPTWSLQAANEVRTPFLILIRRHFRLIAFATLLMAAATTFSHGTQDLYPTFLKVQHGLGVREISLIAIIYNIGAIGGSLTGGALSQLIGRRRQIMAASALALLILPLWACASSIWLLAATAFVVQFLVQCTFGVLPAHLNEIAPGEMRSTFAGVVYQLGNMLTAANATFQALLAEGWLKGNYGTSLALTAGAGAIILCLAAAFSSEAKDDLLESSRDK